jgi:hypothetical protein
MFDCLATYLTTLYGYAVAALNSMLMRSLLVAFFGALFGAYTAKRIADRTKLKDELLKEIRNLNAGSVIAHSIANAHLGLKRQHVKGLYDTFHAKRNEFNEKLAQRAAGVPAQQIQFEIGFDLQTLAPLTQPVVPLQTIVFDKITASAKAIMLTGVLSQTQQSLNDALTSRNALIESWRQRALPQDQVLPLYFGLPRPGGRDETYPSLIDAIYSYTDDVICFSMMLGDELASQADEAKKHFDTHFPRSESPMITKVEFPDISDLMPPPEKFTDFGKRFRPQQRPKKLSFWERLHTKVSAKKAL